MMLPPSMIKQVQFINSPQIQNQLISEQTFALKLQNKYCHNFKISRLINTLNAIQKKMHNSKLELGILEDRVNSESSNEEEEISLQIQKKQMLAKILDKEKIRQNENKEIIIQQQKLISRSNISEASEQPDQFQEVKFQKQIQLKQPRRVRFQYNYFLKLKNYMDKVDIILDVLSKDPELQVIEIEDLKTPVDDKVRQIMSEIYQVFALVFQQNLRTQVDIDISYPLGTYKAIVKMEFLKEYTNQDLNFNEQQLIYREYSRSNFNSVCGVAFLFVFQEVAKRLLGYQKLPKLLELFIMFTEYLVKGSKGPKRDDPIQKPEILKKKYQMNDDGEKEKSKNINIKHSKAYSKNSKNKGDNDDYLKLLQKYQKVES